MTAPDKIYIPSLLAADVVSYKTDGGIEYIRKDALVEWAREQFEVYGRITEQGGADIDFGRMNAFSMMINKLESM